MHNRLNLTAELWAYCLASFAMYKIIAAKAHLPLFCEFNDARRIFIMPEITANKITITCLYRPLRALLSPARLADVDALKDDLQTPAWRKLCRAWVSFEITENGPKFLNSEASVRSKRFLANPGVKRIPTFSEVRASLSK